MTNRHLNVYSAVYSDGECRWRRECGGRPHHHERSGANAPLVVRVRLRMAPQMGRDARPEERAAAAAARHRAHSRPPDRPVRRSRAHPRGRPGAPRHTRGGGRPRTRTSAPIAHSAHRGLLCLNSHCILLIITLHLKLFICCLLTCDRFFTNSFEVSTAPGLSLGRHCILKSKAYNFFHRRRCVELILH